MTANLYLREVNDDALLVFFEMQKDPEAVRMAAFTPENPADREAFEAHWQRIMNTETVIVRTVIWNGEVAGHVLSYEVLGKPEVSYWIARHLWGKGIATRALKLFLADVNRKRPIYGRVARDNLASIRVMEKCGFRVIEETKGFANARGEEIDELVLELRQGNERLSDNIE